MVPAFRASFLGWLKTDMTAAEVEEVCFAAHTLMTLARGPPGTAVGKHEVATKKGGLAYLRKASAGKNLIGKFVEARVRTRPDSRPGLCTSCS